MAELSDVVKGYLAYRDKRDALKKKHKEELAPVEAAMEKIEAFMLVGLDKAGAQSINIEGAGTLFKKLDTKYNVEAWDVTLDYVLKTPRLDLLERRVNKTVAAEIEESEKIIVPGLKVFREYKAHVQRS